MTVRALGWLGILTDADEAVMLLWRDALGSSQIIGDDATARVERS